MNLICISGSSGVGKTTIAKLIQYIIGEDITNESSTLSFWTTKIYRTHI
jgi:uridine kinase